VIYGVHVRGDLDFDWAHLSGDGAARSRLPWLSRDPEGYRPQPYEHLATHYRQRSWAGCCSRLSLPP
jgi:hypothetical protein